MQPLVNRIKSELSSVREAVQETENANLQHLYTVSRYEHHLPLLRVGYIVIQLQLHVEDANFGMLKVIPK